jgi:hypothetical protein
MSDDELKFSDEPAQPDDKEKLRRNRPAIANVKEKLSVGIYNKTLKLIKVETKSATVKLIVTIIAFLKNLVKM